MIILEKNKVYRFNVNDYLYIDIVYNGEEVLIDSFGNTPPNTISVSSTSKKTIIKVAGIPKCTIDLENGKVHTNSKLMPTSTVRNYSEIIRTKAKEDEYLYNHLQYSKNDGDEVVQNETELHTHFMEILSGEEYLQLVLKHLKFIGLDSNGNLCRSYPTDSSNPRLLDDSMVYHWISREDILSNRDLYNNLVMQLSLPIDRQVPFTEINKILTRRTALLDLIGYNNAKSQIDSIDVPYNELDNAVRKLRSDAKADIYVEILLMSLATLKKQGIKYVELSYSTPNTITKMFKKLKDIKIEGIKFNFLLSENRNAQGMAFREYYVDGVTGEKRRNKRALELIIPKMIKAGYITGFDLMGMEQKITSSDYEKDSAGNSSLYDKLSPVLKVLNSFNDNNLICRLHAGEIQYEMPDPDGKSNPERTLEILDKIVQDNNLTVPPPSIRLGHGLHIQKNSNYLLLLKKYKVTIEINSSSNFALGNIKNMSDIPYRWYYENNIPVVLGTDGGGFYLATPASESQNAELFGGRDVAKGIHETDQSEMRRRGL